jgi:formyl-CoA transferase
LIDAAVAGKDMAEWREIFRAHEVIWGPVPRTEHVASDRQMEVNGVFPEIEPGLRTVANPLSIEGVEKVKPRMAPEVGEHTVEILESLGYSAKQIGDLLERGVALDGSKNKEAQAIQQ